MNPQDLERLLEGFSARYKGKVTVSTGVVELTSCFMKEAEWKGPGSFNYDGSPEFKVIAEVARGHAFVEKYATDNKGNVKWTEIGGKIHTELLPFTEDFKVISCLCLQPLSNTSLYEVYTAMRRKDEIQGFRKWHIQNIVEKLQQSHDEFNPEKDSAFMFAGHRREPHGALHNYWLEQIIENGSKALGMMNSHEAALVAMAFNYWPKGPVTLETARQFGYRRPSDSRLHTEESVLFAYRKLQAFHKFAEAAL